ncbi:MAG: tetratricopeptide repeat protein, partial [Victivallales bacterium]|nr:tetratricopeptide repeat protein [Victivallales bacterium]
AYARQGESSKAIKNYKKAIEIKPDHINAYTNLIEILIITGDCIEANNYLEQVKKIKKSVQDTSVFSMLNTIFVLAKGEDAKVELEQFKEVLEGDVSLSWSFDELDEWLESPELKLRDDIKKKIEEDVIAPFKARQAELKDK